MGIDAPHVQILITSNNHCVVSEASTVSCYPVHVRMRSRGYAFVLCRTKLSVLKFFPKYIHTATERKTASPPHLHEILRLPRPVRAPGSLTMPGPTMYSLAWPHSPTE